MEKMEYFYIQYIVVYKFYALYIVCFKMPQKSGINRNKYVTTAILEKLKRDGFLSEWCQNIV